MSAVNLNADEARLIGLTRAIHRFSEEGIVRPADASHLLDYYKYLVDLKTVESTNTVDVFLDGFVAGVGAARLASAGLEVNEIPETSSTGQTGVDPKTGEVRH